MKRAQFSISYNQFYSLSVSNVCQPEDFQSFQTVAMLCKVKRKSLKYGLFKPFLRLLDVAGAEGLEPSARGFGDRCSTN